MSSIASIGIVEPYYAWLPSTADINNLAPIQKMVPDRRRRGHACKLPHGFTGTIRERRYEVSRFIPRWVSVCIVTGTASGMHCPDVSRLCIGPGTESGSLAIAGMFPRPLGLGMSRPGVEVPHPKSPSWVAPVEGSGRISGRQR
jgi:hypothetical protein